jgi:hypothetical protein
VPSNIARLYLPISQGSICNPTHLTVGIIYHFITLTLLQICINQQMKYELILIAQTTQQPTDKEL